MAMLIYQGFLIISDTDAFFINERNPVQQRIKVFV